MAHREVEKASTTDGLPVSVSLGPALEAASVPSQATLVDRRVVFISVLSILLAVVAAFIAQGLMRLISLITNVAFYSRLSFDFSSPARSHRGWIIVVIPVIGGLIVGAMARYGSKAIRGHGIPEAMEQVLLNQSRIPFRVMFLKPISAAIAIGTGGPFGAEGPIIATGGALGSVIGQLISTTATERKTLLSAGAAAGMAATFGSPVSAVLLAVELLLFEFRPRSIIPVALASAAAAGTRLLFSESHAVFPMPNLLPPGAAAIFLYMAVGAIVGVAAVLVTRAVYLVEDAFELLPVHWMWWPAIGAIAVGIIGYFHPLTLGVGYSNITSIISAQAGFTPKFIAILAMMKFVSWCIALGSGTSGGTLAPLFTIGSGLGLLLGIGMAALFPHAGIDPRIAALVGMAAIFAGASRALLASAVFAFETTLQPLGLLPLLGGCTGAFLVSCLLMRNTIMTEKIARRGVRVPAEYEADFLDQIPVRDMMSSSLAALRADDLLSKVRTWLASDAPETSHQGYPVHDDTGLLVGVLTRRDLLKANEPLDQPLRQLIHHRPIFVYDDTSLREAADHMVNHDVGRLAVLSRETRRVIAMITRGDILSAHRRRLHDNRHIRHGLLRQFGARSNGDTIGDRSEATSD